jgi:dihydroxy-acid dehydratase
LALVQDGDTITIDAEKNSLDVNVSPEDLAKRKEKWIAPPLKATRGTLYKFIKSVKSASEGCVTDA